MLALRHVSQRLPHHTVVVSRDVQNVLNVFLQEGNVLLQSAFWFGLLGDLLFSLLSIPLVLLVLAIG